MIRIGPVGYLKSGSDYPGLFIPQNVHRVQTRTTNRRNE